ncbi:hypothetical protein BN1723_000100 [Verticillium longisporum]|uniref:Uncharacterized protein n=1 Tax=Verticillium longisporum TaxID=100787 RepID=A0A0G4KE03_VERLO|nr:hypothetical protein BN1723_000100 [Verticillium longisporum]
MTQSFKDTYAPELEDIKTIARSLEAFRESHLSETTDIAHVLCQPGNPREEKTLASSTDIATLRPLEPVPDDANKLQISASSLESLTKHLTLPAAFIFALTRYYLPNGRGSRQIKIGDKTCHDTWYFLPVRVQVEAVGTNPTADPPATIDDDDASQMNPFYKLHLPDVQRDIHRSIVALDSLGGTELDLDKSLEERGSDLSRLTDAAYIITMQSVYSCCLLVRFNETSMPVTDVLHSKPCSAVLSLTLTSSPAATYIILRLMQCVSLIQGDRADPKARPSCILLDPSLISATRFGHVHEGLVLVAETWTTCSDNTPSPRTAHRHYYQVSDPATGRPGTHLAGHSPAVRNSGSKRPKTSGHQRESKLG